jgi:hypothetical protein
MKKGFAFIAILVMLLFITKPTLAVEWSGYLENSVTVNNEDEFTGVNKFKLDLEEKKNQCLIMVSGNVINYYGTATDTDYELNRAYTAFYPNWGIITVGKQRIALGNSYFFNLVDLFNPTNLFDPKDEMSSINGISVKWNVTETNQAEGIILPTAETSKSDYCIKFKYTMGLFDIMVNSLKKSDLSTEVLERRSYIIEAKGEFSNISPGFWFQYAFNSDETVNGTDDYQSYILGCDYTFNIGTGFYLLGEYLRDGLKNVDQFYFTTEYKFQSYLILKTSGLYVGEDASFYSAGLEYQINDNIELTGTYYVFPEGSSKLGELFDSSQDIKHEIEFKLKTTF